MEAKPPPPPKVLVEKHTISEHQRRPHKSDCQLEFVCGAVVLISVGQHHTKPFIKKLSRVVCLSVRLVCINPFIFAFFTSSPLELLERRYIPMLRLRLS
jgi:predicted protein tyrosine phosphatase